MTERLASPQEMPERHLLIVDDEEGIRNALSRFLTRRGFTVSTAAEGETALALVSGQRFLVMICDLHMPGMSGMEVTKGALAIDADLAVIMLTGANEGTMAADALRIGASHYLTKPMELSELTAAIERALEFRQSRMKQRNTLQRLSGPGTSAGVTQPAA